MFGFEYCLGGAFLKGVIISFLFCVFVEMLINVMLPEGVMRKFCLMIVGLYLFSVIVLPLCEFINGLI